MRKTIWVAPILTLGCVPAALDMPIDADGDGLLTDQEEDAGTDPDDPDSDGDDFTDGEEVTQNTDPLDDQSHPYHMGWGIGACKDSVESTGDMEGDIASDFEARDQYDETVRFHDFCDKAILLENGAFW